MEFRVKEALLASGRRQFFLNLNVKQSAVAWHRQVGMTDQSRMMIPFSGSKN